MGSVNRLPDKEKRRARRRNHIARDLHKTKYFQRVMPSKKKEYDEDFWLEQEEDPLD